LNLPPRLELMKDLPWSRAHEELKEPRPGHALGEHCTEKEHEQ